MKKQHLLIFILFFCAFLAWGIFSTGWYKSGHLLVQGTAVKKKADLVFSWDSGHGFNRYESQEFLLNIPRRENTLQHIRIQALSIKDPASKSTTVSILHIFLDGKEFNLKKVRPRSIFHDRLAIQLTPKNPIYEFYAPVKGHIRIVLANSYYFGKVAVNINGVTSIIDCYTSNGSYYERPYDYFFVQPSGNFQFTFNLPRYRIKKLLLKNKNSSFPVVFSKISLVSGKFRRIVSNDKNLTDNRISFQNPNRPLKRFFDPVRFWFKVLFSLGNAGILCFLISFIQRKGGLKSFFLEKKRRYFWCITSIFAILNIFFLIPFWPGVMSQDSLYIWRASGLPEIYMNNHPVLNLLFYMYLRGLWNNPAVVSLFQILATSLLIGYIFYRIRNSGVSAWLLFPFVLLLFCAMPIYLYNMMLWKDIPFALFVIGWGAYLAFFNARDNQENIPSGFTYWFLFFLAYICLGFFRYNGLVYLAVVPILWVVASPYSWKKGICYSLIVIILAFGILFGMKNIRTIGGLKFLMTALKQHTMFLDKTSISHELTKTGEGYFQVFDMDKKGTISDKWHYYLMDRYSWNFLKQTNLSNYYGYVSPKSSFPKIRDALIKCYFASYKSPWKYIVWNPVYMLVLVLIVILCFRWFPSAATFSFFLLCGVVPLVALRIFNWRYYYFFYFGLYFILPLILFDLRKRKTVSV